ncbi:transmembrane protein 81 [Thomomys bottae]
MKAARSILGILLLATYRPVLVTSPENLTIPELLQNAVGRVLVNATSCSVTCGLGYKEETVCEVGSDGVRKKCKFERLECVASWSCGMLHFTVLAGSEFELSCLSSDILAVGKEAFRFTWRVARGIISINDVIFKPYRSNMHFLQFKPALEYHSGTYRCDVQQLKNLRLVKRVYFGLRVLPSKLVNLNFDQYLTENQKLVDEGFEVNLDNYSKLDQPKWQKRVISTLSVGAVVGVLVGVLVSIALCRVLSRILSTGIQEKLYASLLRS